MKTFPEVIDNISEYLNELFEELLSSPLKEIKETQNINGIYVFYEDGKALYVGRTNRMKDRLNEHHKHYSNQNSATFALRIAREMKKSPSFSRMETTDEDFMAAKDRVSKMKVRCIQIDDQIIQTIFEPYVAYKLKTTEKYNDFGTH